MKALVLIGGFGTRLRPVTYTIPKQLIPIAGKAMLFHVLDLLPPEVDEVVLATGYKADAIAQHIREHPFRIPVRTVIEHDPLGTGGGLKNAGGDTSDPFFLLNSDVIAQVDLSELLRFHARRKGLGTMALTEVEDPSPYGVAQLGPDDRVQRFVEKPSEQDAPSHWINAGVAVWSRSVLDDIPDGRPVSFEQEVIPGLLDRGIYGFRISGYWEDAGTPARLLHAQRLLFDAGRAGRTTLPAGSYGSGPVAFGRGTSADGASFGRYVTLGENVHVDAGAHLENSIVMDGAVIGKEATVAASILGPRVKIQAAHRIEGAILGEGAEA